MVSATVLVWTLFVGATLAAPSRNDWPEVFNIKTIKTRAAIRDNGNANVVRGGIETSTRVHPSIVQVDFFVQSLGSWLQVCGGSIVTSMAVVSAARCTDVFFDTFYDVSNRRIRAGADNRNTGGQLAYVHSVLNHPNFSYDTMEWDINIIRLSSPLVFGDNIQSISILPQDFTIPDNYPVVYPGWGPDQESGLLDAGATTINLKQCAGRDELPPNLKVTENVFCAVLPYPSTDFCFIDTGGPIYVRSIDQNILAGLGFFGPCLCTDPGELIVNINVATFSDWLVANA